jgi:hypothetical protein
VPVVTNYRYGIAATRLFHSLKQFLKQYYQYSIVSANIDNFGDEDEAFRGNAYPS